MGVDRDDYIIYGYKLPVDYFKGKGIDIHDSPELEPMTCGAKDEPYRIIYDFMSGNYTVFGKLIYHVDEYGGIDMHILSPDDLNVDDQAVIDKLTSIIGTPDDTLPPPAFIVFTHWH